MLIEFISFHRDRQLRKVKWSWTRNSFKSNNADPIYIWSISL